MLLCACRSRMAWPYRSVLCPPPWDDWGGDEGHRVRTDAQYIWPIPGGNVIPIKYHAQAWMQGSLSSDPQQILCLSFPALGSRGSVSEKSVGGGCFISPKAHSVLPASSTLFTRPQVPQGGWPPPLGTKDTPRSPSISCSMVLSSFYSNLSHHG